MPLRSAEQLSRGAAVAWAATRHPHGATNFFRMMEPGGKLNDRRKWCDVVRRERACGGGGAGWAWSPEPQAEAEPEAGLCRYRA